TARNARRSTLFIRRYGLGADAGVYKTLVSPAGTRSLVYSPRQHIPQEGPVKILFFDDFKLGVLKGDAVVDGSDRVRDIPLTGPHNLISGLIERFADYKRHLEEVVIRGQSLLLGH